MRQLHQMRMPVTMEVGVSHIRITSVSDIATAMKFAFFINVSVGQSTASLSFIGMQINGNYLTKRR